MKMYFTSILLLAAIPSLVAQRAQFRESAPTPTTTRNREIIVQFEKQTGHPKGWKNHVVDHMIPLCAGGPDVITNLEWQSLKRSYAKDGFERRLCAALKKEGYVLVKQ